MGALGIVNLSSAEALLALLKVPKRRSDQPSEGRFDAGQKSRTGQLDIVERRRLAAG